MPNINPMMTCHLLNINPAACYVSQRRIRQSLNKAKAIVSTMKFLLDGRFISKAKYTKWISNVFLVKRALRKFMMYVD